MLKKSATVLSIVAVMCFNNIGVSMATSLNNRY